MTVNEIITQQIIDRIEEAKRTGKTFHWVKPFGENACRYPVSYEQSRSYTGVNRLLLQPDEYMTMNKASELGCTIRKGCHSRMDAEFLNWLTKDKSLSTRSAKDVISRYKRVCGLLKTDSLVNYTVDDLNLIVEFNDKSMFVKSQLKRALTLWKEYYELCQKKDIQ